MSEQTKLHGVIIENRRKVMIEGVKDVESFNESEVIVVTHSGGLRIKGRKFEMVKICLDSGILEMSGDVSGLQYSDSDRTPNNIIMKLFR